MSTVAKLQPSYVIYNTWQRRRTWPGTVDGGQSVDHTQRPALCRPTERCSREVAVRAVNDIIAIYVVNLLSIVTSFQRH